MKRYSIEFGDRDTTPDKLEVMAAELHITPEQLIKRFVAEGFAAADPDTGPAVPGATLQDFFVKNGIWKAG